MHHQLQLIAIALRSLLVNSSVASMKLSSNSPTRPSRLVRRAKSGIAPPCTPQEQHARCAMSCQPARALSSDCTEGARHDTTIIYNGIETRSESVWLLGA